MFRGNALAQVIMNAKELRKKDTSELQESIMELKKKLSDIRFTVSGGGLKNTNEIKNIKKEIARMLTIIKETNTKKQ
jgi:large subunit ribosomal protein L29